MGFENCNICGKLFDKKKSDLCPACDEIETTNFKKVINYLQKFEKSPTKSFTLKMISFATGVEIKDIERLYRLNKLRNYTNFIDLDCKLCGTKFKPTRHSGVFCKNCTTKVEKVIDELKESANNSETKLITDKSKDVVKASKKEEPSNKSGMHMKEDTKKRCGFKKN